MEYENDTLPTFSGEVYVTVRFKYTDHENTGAVALAKASANQVKAAFALFNGMAGSAVIDYEVDPAYEVEHDLVITNGPEDFLDKADRMYEASAGK